MELSPIALLDKVAQRTPDLLTRHRTDAISASNTAQRYRITASVEVQARERLEVGVGAQPTNRLLFPRLQD